MSINIFRRTYTIRKFDSQGFIHGYSSETYTDSTALLNVQPSGGDNYTMDEGGSRVTRSLVAYGNDILNPASQETETKGDRLFWYGHWYECQSCETWDHTPLAHYRMQFTLVPETDSTVYYDE